jgi:recA bacterial DNA recombination protein
MPSATTIRLQIEAALAHRAPSVLTPPPRLIRPMAATGISAVDELLEGGIPLGAITEMSGPECSGRSTLALSFLAQRTREGKVCAWIDVTDAFQPETAAASRIDLSRLLWVRCGTIPEASTSGKVSFQLPKECLVPPAAKKGLYAGGWGGHPRGEVKGLADAVGDLLQTPSPHEHEASIRQEPRTLQGNLFPGPVQSVSNAQNQAERINQARRVTEPTPQTCLAAGLDIQLFTNDPQSAFLHISELDPVFSAHLSDTASGQLCRPAGCARLLRLSRLEGFGFQKIFQHNRATLKHFMNLPKMHLLALGGTSLASLRVVCPE